MTKLPIGDFCDTARAMYVKRGTADYIAKNDKEHELGVLAHNEYGAKTCPEDSPFWRR